MDLSSWLECKPELSFCNPYKNDANTMHGKGGRAGADAHTEKSGSHSNSSLPSKSERRVSFNDGEDVPPVRHHCKGKEAGVGIIFEERMDLDRDGESPNHRGRGHGLTVKSMMNGGPAHATGKIKQGMVLISVDGVDIRSLRSEDIAPIILGEPGSMAELRFHVDGAEPYNSKIFSVRVKRAVIA